MSRIILQFLLPFLLPTVVYFAWRWFAKHEGKNDGTLAARLQDGPWFWLAVSGAVMVAAVLGTVAMLGGASPNGTYVAPRWENGTIVPGHFK